MPGLTFRSWLRGDEPFLWEMLYQSLYVRTGDEPFPRSVLDQPGISRYLDDFGHRAGDDAQIAAGPGGDRVGAAWCRLFGADDPGYAFVTDDVPELGMAVVGSNRGQGVGRRLLGDLLERHPIMSLSVNEENDSAFHLYRSFGFAVIESIDGSAKMLRSNGA